MVIKEKLSNSMKLFKNIDNNTEYLSAVKKKQQVKINHSNQKKMGQKEERERYKKYIYKSEYFFSFFSVCLAYWWDTL